MAKQDIIVNQTSKPIPKIDFQEPPDPGREALLFLDEKTSEDTPRNFQRPERQSEEVVPRDIWFTHSLVPYADEGGVFTPKNTKAPATEIDFRFV